MKIFISHSLGSTDLYIASRLIHEAQAKGITVTTSQQQLAAPTSWTPANVHPIIGSDVVVAIATRDSRDISSVLGELQTAITYRRTTLALVEKGRYVHISAPTVQLIEFDRRNLSDALNQVNAILESRKNEQNANQWLVAGGLALLALYLIGKEE